MIAFNHPDFEKELARMRAENPTATAMFMCSLEQLERSHWSSAMMGVKYIPSFFRDKQYTEMRQFKHGTETNFNDMVLLGVGTDDDITFGKP